MLPSAPFLDQPTSASAQTGGRGSGKSPIEPSQLRKLVDTQPSQKKVIQIDSRLCFAFFFFNMGRQQGWLARALSDRHILEDVENRKKTLRE